LPVAVTTRDDGYLELNAGPILASMLNAIKELKADIHELKKRIV